MTPNPAALALLALTLATAACSRAGAPNFRLRDDRSAAWQLSQQRGKAVLLTFGFTHCLDTCPATLAKLERLTTSLGIRANEVELVFITVDPARDTPEVMHRFVGRFVEPHGSTIVGLTGTRAQIASVEDAYHVWSAPMPERSSRHTYDVAHSAVIVFVDPSGRVRAIRDDDDSARSLRSVIEMMLG